MKRHAEKKTELPPENQRQKKGPGNGAFFNERRIRTLIEKKQKQQALSGIVPHTKWLYSVKHDLFT